MASRSTARLALLLTALLAVVACDKAKGNDKETPPTTSASAAASAPPPPPSAATRAVVDAGTTPLETVEVPEVRIRPGASTTVRVGWVTPRGTAVNDDAPFRVRWNRSDGLNDAPSDVKSTGSAVKDGFRVKVQPMPGAPNASLTGEINIVVCDAATHSICVPVRRSVELGFVVAKDAAEEANVSIPLPEARHAN